ncbi:MAG: hypothetical protein OEZ36_10095, partial [Spirochaetota bacterium]|nr:hypothetical protein [Spirochaetota bacterium]
SLFAKRHIFEQTNGFSEEYKIVSDYDWMLKTFVELKCKNSYLDRSISVISKDGLSNTMPFEAERLRVMRHYYTDFEIFLWRILPLKYKKIRKFLIMIIKKVLGLISFRTA